jgi:hypothetical protein
MGLLVARASHKSLPVDVRDETAVPPQLIRATPAISHSALIMYSERTTSPKAPARQETWEVGYIVNVLWEDLVAYYGSQREKLSLLFGGPIIDKMRESQTPWYFPAPTARLPSGQMQIFQEFDYGGGLRGRSPMIAELNIIDTPVRLYFNEYKGKRGEPQLREIRDTITFGIWIAARRKADSPSIVSNYTILYAAKVTIPIHIKISSDLCPLVSGGIHDMSIPKKGKLVAPFGSIQFSQVPGVKPVVSGPRANDLLVRKLVASGIVYSRPHMDAR